MDWWTAALLVAFALLIWAFAVLLSNLIEERARGWLRVMLVTVLAPTCALAAVAVSAVAGMTLVTALEPDEVPVRTEPTDPETTSDETVPSSPSASPSGTPSPSPSPSP